MKQILLIIFLVLIAACGQQTISYKEISKRTDASKDILKKFGSQLKDELQNAIQSDGLIAAISVCNEKAPLLAKQLSLESGWDIRRTSLKPRATKPDEWETKVMQSFEQKHANGDKFKLLFTQDVVAVNGKAAFRYMQAIETQPLCLACHGENIAPEVAKQIASLYPNDSATGFKLGDIRGAFSIIQALD
ncbi:hypothetical protein MNBD_GAMMA01-907 [hydrothermal vent metagenome]|uniref:Tll0287-like domain-containing protein n=1 Tax=hydrothermal vent metagenome TaxID=652676 RepID=A0A3B0VFK6_9ZZZZ